MAVDLKKHRLVVAELGHNMDVIDLDAAAVHRIGDLHHLQGSPKLPPPVSS